MRTNESIQPVGHTARAGIQWGFAALVLALCTLMPEMAAASELNRVICNIVKWFGPGDLGGTLVIGGLMIVGIMFLTGRMSWTQFLIFAIGGTLIISASTILQQLGIADNGCQLG